MKKIVVLTVTLNPALDKVCKVSDFRLGLEHRVQENSLSAGGKGINVSRALKSLGLHALSTGFSGGVPGEQLKAILRKEGIPQAFFTIRGETRINYTVCDANSRVTRLLEPGPRVSPSEAYGFYKEFICLLSSPRYVVFSGQFPSGLTGRDIVRFLGAAKKLNKKIILDMGGSPQGELLKIGPDLVKPNLSEAEILVGRSIKSRVQMKAALNDIFHQGARQIIISLGEEGAVGFDGKEFWMAAAPRKQVIRHTVGCGDALVAGFIFSDNRGQGFAESLRFAVACGTANLSADCPGNILKGAVQRLWRHIQLKKI